MTAGAEMTDAERAEFHAQVSEERGREITRLKRLLHETERERHRLRSELYHLITQVSTVGEQARKIDTGPWIVTVKDEEWALHE